MPGKDSQTAYHCNIIPRLVNGPPSPNRLATLQPWASSTEEYTSSIKVEVSRVMYGVGKFKKNKDCVRNFRSKNKVKLNKYLILHFWVFYGQVL